MKKLLLILFLGMFLISFVSAADWDNKITYSNNDLKVNFKNSILGIIPTTEIGNVELKSHSSINEVKEVGIGKQVVMWYDFDFKELEENGLGKITFINEVNKNEEDKEYSFVYWGDKIVETNLFKECDEKKEPFCKSEIIGKKNVTIKDWIPYNSKDIPKGKITIGIKTEVKVGDYIDGVWEIVGKKITKHAKWTASLNVDIQGYYNFEEGTGTTTRDVTNHYNNLTSANTPGWTTSGIIENATDLNSGGVEYFYNDTAYESTDDYTFNVWVKPETSIDSQIVFSKPAGISGERTFLLQQSSGKWQAGARRTTGNNNYASSTSSVDVGHWQMITFITNSTGNSIWINGTMEGYLTNTNPRTVLASYPFYIGDDPNNPAFNGIIDEFGVWNRSLSGEEIQSQLFNGGGANTYTNQFPPTVTAIAPGNNTGYSTSPQSIDFICYGEDDSNFTKMEFYLNGILNQTNSSGLNATNYTFNVVLTNGDYNWSCSGYNENSEQTSTGDLFVSIDGTAPMITIQSPSTNYNYLTSGKVIDLNFTVTDNQLSQCWWDYNGTNNTISCSNNTLVDTSFIQEVGNFDLIVYANDTASNLGMQSVTWNVGVFENSRNFSSTTYETDSETYSINVTANSSLTAVSLNLNGTLLSSTQSGNIWSNTLDIPTSKVGNNTIKWQFTYGGDSFYSDSTYQNISSIIFTECNSTFSEPFLNLTFKDESTLTYINATIPTSTFEYYLGSGTVTKSLNYVNTTESFYFDFCATPDLTFKVSPYVQYKKGTDYPQRIWSGDLTNYNSTTTQETLYLLSSIDGIYVTFQLINSLEQGIEGVNVIGTREIDGETVIVSNGLTGAGGGVTFWLNPDFSHDFNFSKTGYETYSISLTPTQTTYTVTLSGEETENPDFTEGINYIISPSGNFLQKNENYEFTYLISATESNLEEYGFTLKADGIEVNTQSGTDPGGETLTYTYNVTATEMVMNYYYLINSTYINGTRSWLSYTPNEFSINYFLGNIVDKIDENIFGIKGDDEGVFAKSLLSILIIIIVAGILSSRYGLASEQAVSGIIFGTLLFLNNLNFLPTISDFPSTGVNLDTGTFAVFLAAAWVIFSIFKEESR